MSSVSKLKIAIGNKSIEVKGDAELIEKERSAFFEYIKHVEDKLIENRVMIAKAISTNVKMESGCAENTGDLMITRKSNVSGSWNEVEDRIRNNPEYFHIGDIISDKLRDGTAVEWIVTDVTDKYVRFESRDCIESHCMNEQRTNRGGVAESSMQKFLDKEIFGLLPDDLQRVISETTRSYMDGDEKKEFKTKLFLPSASEVFDYENCYGEDNLYSQLDFYKDRRNRIKYGKSGGSAYWWLSSPSAGGTTHFCAVGTSGTAGCHTASNAYGVAPCFIINRS